MRRVMRCALGGKACRGAPIVVAFAGNDDPGVALARRTAGHAVAAAPIRGAAA